MIESLVKLRIPSHKKLNNSTRIKRIKRRGRLQLYLCFSFSSVFYYLLDHLLAELLTLVFEYCFCIKEGTINYVFA
ncbi:MAG: hypothetical protein ACRD8Z_10925, partial [Nitrososphaeraceae archaeon]